MYSNETICILGKRSPSGMSGDAVSPGLYRRILNRGLVSNDLNLQHLDNGNMYWWATRYGD